MAFIRTRKLGDGSTAYQVFWDDPTGTRQSRQFSRATTPRPAEAAKRFKVEVEAELQRGTYVDPRAGQTTFREFAQGWRASLHQRRSSDERLEQILHTHVYPLIGDMRIGAIRRREIQAMVAALAVKPIGGHRGADNPRSALAPSYVENIYRIVAGIFRAAVLDQIIPVSPCLKIKLPEAGKAQIVIPTPGQVEQVAERISPRYRALVLTAAGTGLRSGELRGLDLARCRLLERVVVVDRQLHTPDRGPHYYGPPKSAAGYRRVPLSPSYAEVIAEHLERYGPGAEGLVFTGRSARPIHRRSVAMALGPILDELGFPPRAGLHVFRHYYASGLIAAGVDVLTVMRRLGHASSEETLGTYGHLWHDHEERTREAVEASFPVGRQVTRKSPKSPTGHRHSGAQVTPLSSHAHHAPQVNGG